MLGKAGITDEFTRTDKPPYEFRWDVMYAFTHGVFTSIEELLAELAR